MESLILSRLAQVDWLFVVGLLLTVYAIERLPRWLEMVKWMLNGPGLLASKYSTGMPFTIETPGRRYHLVSSAEHIKELSQAKEAHLSLVATAEEVFQPAHTMNGVDMTRLDMQHRILRTMSVSLPKSQEPLSALVKETITNSLASRAQDHEGWRSMSIFSLTQSTVARANAYSFYGRPFTNDTDFLDAAMRYPQDVFIAAEVVRCFPSWCAPVVSWLVTLGHRSSNTLISKLLPVFQRRVDGETPPTMDYIQHIVNVFPKTSANSAIEMIKQTLALWFASVHQPAIALCNFIVDLCVHEEWQGRLRAEIEENIESHGYLNLSSLPLMESFMKESARLNASESISLRRKAKESFTFQDGLVVAKGDWLCVPQRSIMRDSSIYHDADSFNGSRFMQSEQEDGISHKITRFADISTFFPLWGLGKHACPGRFYASFIIKLTLIELLQHYDIRLRKKTSTRNFRWRSSILPMPHAQFELRSKG